MTLYESIFVRRSIRNLQKTKIDDSILEGLVSFYHDIEPLFPGICTSIEIIEKQSREARKLRGFLNVSAPYYLAIYSEEKEKSDMNAGYLMQQMSLYLFSRGIGSCFQGRGRLSGPVQDGLHLVILLAFGYPKGELVQKNYEPRRMKLEELCFYKEKPKKWIRDVLEAARIAPSARNSQPWRFVVYENRIHVFSTRSSPGRSSGKKYNEFDFGVMMANIMIVAEQLWVDVDLIKLDNVSHITLPNNQYVISILMRE